MTAVALTAEPQIAIVAGSAGPDSQAPGLVGGEASADPATRR